jgi:hypothetical protein
MNAGAVAEINDALALCDPFEERMSYIIAAGVCDEML